MVWVLTLLLNTGFATMEVRHPAHCWVALSWAIRQARVYQTAMPSTGFAIKGASCKRVGGMRA